VLFALQVAAACLGEGSATLWSHFAFRFMDWMMRAEAEQLVESIKQSVGLLRRHL
jgi:hypothetical protein